MWFRTAINGKIESVFVIPSIDLKYYLNIILNVNPKCESFHLILKYYLAEWRKGLEAGEGDLIIWSDFVVVGRISKC